MLILKKSYQYNLRTYLSTSRTFNNLLLIESRRPPPGEARTPVECGSTVDCPGLDIVSDVIKLTGPLDKYLLH